MVTADLPTGAICSNDSGGGYAQDEAAQQPPAGELPRRDELPRPWNHRLRAGWLLTNALTDTDHNGLGYATVQAVGSRLGPAPAGPLLRALCASSHSEHLFHTISKFCWLLSAAQNTETKHDE